MGEDTLNKDNPDVVDLELIYRETLRQCAPETLVGRVASAEMPRHVVAIGKCAGPLLDGFAATVPIESAFAVVPRGYPPPRSTAGVTVMHGGHPEIDEESLAAGEELVRYVDAHRDITFLVSGGGSACVELPLRPFFTADDVIATNRTLLRAGVPIADMNAVRKHLSAIKGGRLGARVRGTSVSLVYSDVGSGDLASVASGPTVPGRSSVPEAIAILERIGGCDRIVTILRDESMPPTVTRLDNARALLVADNETLVAAAAALVAAAGLRPVLFAGQIETDVAAAARALVERSSELEAGDVLVAGGEPTVEVRGRGRGGRCLELAVRFAMDWTDAGDGRRLEALFASSDGLDGNSGVSGVAMSLPQGPVAFDAAEALAASDSLSAAGRMGRPFIIPPTGNNLRDLYLVARS